MANTEIFLPEVARVRAAEFIDLRVDMYRYGGKHYQNLVKQNLAAAQFLSSYARRAISFEDKHFFVFTPKDRETVEARVAQQYGIDLDSDRLGIHGDKTEAFLAEKRFFQSRISDIKGRVKCVHPIRDQGSWEQWEAYLTNREREIWPLLKDLDKA